MCCLLWCWGWTQIHALSHPQLLMYLIDCKVWPGPRGDALEHTSFKLEFHEHPLPKAPNKELWTQRLSLLPRGKNRAWSLGPREGEDKSTQIQPFQSTLIKKGWIWMDSFQGSETFLRLLNSKDWCLIIVHKKHWKHSLKSSPTGKSHNVRSIQMPRFFTLLN